MQPRESLARRTANELLDEMEIAGPPVPVDEIVRRKGLIFEERRGFPAGVFGALFRSGNTFGIVISAACPTEGHRRFTHLPDHVHRLFANGTELVPSIGGHYRSRKDPLEVEADAFASELLMPGRFVRPLVETLGSGVSAVQTLANQFDASLSAAKVSIIRIHDRAATHSELIVKVLAWSDGTPVADAKKP